jgi:hypothetical protein
MQLPKESKDLLILDPSFKILDPLPLMLLLYMYF